MQAELEERLARSGAFGEKVEVGVSAVTTNDFGEGEYEVRLVYPPDSSAPHGRDFVGRTRRDLEDALPRAWVVGFTLPSRRDEVNEVRVTFDYVPEGALTRTV